MKEITNKEWAYLEYHKALSRLAYHKKRGYNEVDAWSKWRYTSDLAKYEKEVQVAGILCAYFDIEDTIPPFLDNLEEYYKSLP